MRCFHILWIYIETVFSRITKSLPQSKTVLHLWLDSLCLLSTTLVAIRRWQLIVLRTSGDAMRAKAPITVVYAPTFVQYVVMKNVALVQIMYQNLTQPLPNTTLILVRPTRLTANAFQTYLPKTLHTARTSTAMTSAITSIALKGTVNTTISARLMTKAMSKPRILGKILTLLPYRAMRQTTTHQT